MVQRVFPVVVLGLVTSLVRCQENAGTGVAPKLIPCYNTSAIPGITSAYRRPPSTINLLIEYIRKLEDANPNMSAQQLSYQLLQRFRQDGIKRNYELADNDKFIIPYSPRGMEVYKNKILLFRLIPKAEQDLELGDLTPIQMCSLHYMTSGTIDNHVRGDENDVCPKTSRYTSRINGRRKRGLELDSRREFGVEDISSRSTNNISTCPIEQGVVYTNYGAIKAENVLAGIATGLNDQMYLNIDNRYAATLAGDLTEASLYQVPDTVEVGAQGGWNSTINPRYYFLQKSRKLDITDSDIRGDLDGLYMALSMPSWRTTFVDLKISQIIDLYYSPYQRGVFNSSLRACNRNALYNDFIIPDELIKQVYNFMTLLNKAATFKVTLTNDTFAALSKTAVEAFNRYLPQISTADLNCKPDDTNIQRVAADLTLFIDFDWPYNIVQPLLSFLLDNLDINKYGSKYKIINGVDFTYITNTSTYLSEFFEFFNESTYNNQNKGFDYIKVLEYTENLIKEKLNNGSYAGGDSNIILVVPRKAPSESEKSYILQRKKLFTQNLPDLKFIVLANGGNVEDYSSLVTNPTKDVTIHNANSENEDTLKQTGNSLVNNIKTIPRALVNPACGAKFSGSVSSFTITDYVEPNGVIYYRIAPNYFYAGGEHRSLTVRELSFGTINFCHSRDQEQPNNQTSECYLLSNVEKSIDITNYCENTASGCSPLYVSISGNSSNNKCTDDLCRFPDNIKYTISMENVGCTSGSTVIGSSLLSISVLLVISKFGF